MKNLSKIVPAIVVVLVLAIGFMVWQKSQINPVKPVETESGIEVKKIDMSTQPEWVQKLDVTAKKGVSGNGLENVTVTVKGIPADIVSGTTYVIQYQTTNKGAQGALSTTPIDLVGKTSFTKTIDLGTCSTKSCVRHDGVTSVDLELDFVALDGSSPIWSKSLDLE